ncbi:hypothetical protein OIV83_005569 [Microbotryomycetes sp. JL201]|nr:hypothetical protein OIV83_005569 [Microbotryomycetes sp. JL201]
MLWNVALGVIASLALSRLAAAAPSTLPIERATAPHHRHPCKTYYGPTSSAENAVPVNPQTAKIACPVYANQTIEIPVFPYVPYFKNKTLANNYFTTAQLNQIIKNVNNIFSQYKPRIHFKLQTPKYKRVTSIDEWNFLHSLEPETEAQIATMNKKLTIPARGQLAARGPEQMRQLWLYLLPQLGYSGAAGFSYIPTSRFPFLHDGVFIDSSQVFQRHALVAHEIGHWLRLLHTFEGSCAGTDFATVDNNLLGYGLVAVQGLQRV